jgi:hypothetical protein
MRSRRLFTSVAGTALTALTLLLMPAPAYAYSSAHHGSDYVQVYGTNYTLVTVCDMESDGHGVWADVYANGWYYYPGLLDGNGSKSPCYTYSIPTGVYQFRICERYVSCSPWYVT